MQILFHVRQLIPQQPNIISQLTTTISYFILDDLDAMEAKNFSEPEIAAIRDFILKQYGKRERERLTLVAQYM